jgi:hypothetical protein
MPDPRETDQRLKTLSKAARMVYNSQNMTRFDANSLWRDLLVEATNYYRTHLNFLAQAVGCHSRECTTIRDEVVLAKLSQELRYHAISIMDTYNNDLSYEVDRLSQSKLTKTEYNYRLHAWEQDRAVWKNKQIERVLVNYSRNAAVDDFAINNLTVLMDPYGVVKGPMDAITCPECVELVNGGPYRLEEFTAIRMPIHVNCRHIKVIKTKGVTDCSKMWLGDTIQLSEPNNWTADNWLGLLEVVDANNLN